MKKAKHTKTKHTGNTEPERFVVIYDSFAQHSATINGKEVLFELSGCGNEKTVRANLPFLAKVIDNYAAINEMAKAAIVEYYDHEDHWGLTVKRHFNDVFGFTRPNDRMRIFGVTDFKKLDIKTVVAKMDCPYLYISYDDGMNIHLSYYVSDSRPCGEMSLNIEIDNNLTIKSFTSILD